MSGRAIVDLGTLAGWLPKSEASRQDTLSRCIDVASELIEAMTNRRFLFANYTAYHSGARATDFMEKDFTQAQNAVLWLQDPTTRYATVPVTAVSSVVENNRSLNVVLMHSATSFGSGDSVIVSQAKGKMIRATVSGGAITPVPWIPGMGNVKVTYTAGYDDTTNSGPAMPEEIKQLAAELAKLIYQEGRRVGLEQSSEFGVSATYARLLTPYMLKTLQNYSMRNSPQTMVA